MATLRMPVRVKVYRTKTLPNNRRVAIYGDRLFTLTY